MRLTSNKKYKKHKPPVRANKRRLNKTDEMLKELKK